MHYVGNEPIDVSSLPTLELPDTVLFPDESLALTVSRTDPLLRLVEEGDVVVRLGDAPPATVVKFRPRFSEPREKATLRPSASMRARVVFTAYGGESPT